MIGNESLMMNCANNCLKRFIGYIVANVHLLMEKMNGILTSRTPLCSIKAYWSVCGFSRASLYNFQ